DQGAGCSSGSHSSCSMGPLFLWKSMPSCGGLQATPTLRSGSGGRLTPPETAMPTPMPGAASEPRARSSLPSSELVASGGSVPPPLPSSLPDEPPASESDTEPLFDDPSFEEPLSEEPPISEPNSPVSEPNTSPPSDRKSTRLNSSHVS